MALRIVRSLFVVIPIGKAFSDLVVDVAKVDGRSMQPTLNPCPMEQDFILLNKWDRFNVSKGDIVVITSPRDPDIKLVKRITAVEHDLYKTGTGKVTQIPSGYIWIEGDHPRQSLDSNTFGAIPLGLVVAKATYIIWPFNRIQALSNKIPNKTKFPEIY